MSGELFKLKAGSESLVQQYWQPIGGGNKTYVLQLPSHIQSRSARQIS